MLVVIAFESMFGNTRTVADAIAEGLGDSRDPPEVELAPASMVGPETVARADLLVVGGPTHYHGLATRNSIVAGRQLQRRAVLTGHPRPRGIDAWGEVGCPAPSGPSAPREFPGAGRGSLPAPRGQAFEGDDDLRAWLRSLPRLTATAGRAAAFDTRVTSRWAGGAAYAIARRLRRHGYHLLVPPEGFLIDGLLGPLRQDERARARMWGVRLRHQLSL